MNKMFIGFSITAVLFLNLASCSPGAQADEQQVFAKGRFEHISTQPNFDKWTPEYIVFRDTATNCQYVQLSGGDHASIQPLLGPDGLPHCPKVK